MINPEAELVRLGEISDTPWEDFINLMKETVEQEIKDRIYEQMSLAFDDVDERKSTMKQLTIEEEMFQELIDVLRKKDINPNAYEFYLTDEGDKVYMIEHEKIPKPIKVIFEN